MTTITEDFVSFETAKLLKEKGFNKRLITFYITDEAKKEGCFQLMAFTDDKIDNNHSDYCYLAPTHQMAMKWLRRIHNVNIEIPYNRFGKNYKYLIIYKPEVLDDIRSLGVYYHYEEACEAAIKYCLKNLI